MDNHRVLHGRSAFDGKRRMCGAYIGMDDNPYPITVKTTSAALARSKGEAQTPDKPVCSTVPTSAHDLEFILQRDVRTRAKSRLVPSRTYSAERLRL